MFLLSTSNIGRKGVGTQKRKGVKPNHTNSGCEVIIIVIIITAKTGKYVTLNK
jgi:hypothetical protein